MIFLRITHFRLEKESGKWGGEKETKKIFEDETVNRMKERKKNFKLEWNYAYESRLENCLETASSVLALRGSQ